MNPFSDSGGDDFFGGGGDFFGGMGGPNGMGGPAGDGMGGMGRGGSMGGPMGRIDGPMGGGGMGRGGPMGPMGEMGGGNTRQGGYSSFSSYDSSRPEGQQYQESHDPFGGNSRDGGGGHYPTPCGGGGGDGSGRGFMFSGLTRAENPFRRQVGGNPAAGYNPSAREEPRYQQMRGGGPQYEDHPRGQGSGRSSRSFDFGSSRRQLPQQAYFDDESDLEDEGPPPRQSYAPQQSYGGGGARRSGGGSGSGRLFNYDRFGRRN
ncbi:hypothetical protein G6011_03409 [Alternaria panax]|uniref:Uncharacterized protein n=1 Tax=Alternaria panax TaxID=48097 RepID=A0AAD4NT50_9PLEO|nr:hypothetical protein G6011_03409 [Alternaria panax]